MPERGATRNRAAETCRQLREAATKVLVIVLVIATAVALAAGLTIFYRQDFTPAGVYRPEDEGRIADKHLTGRETREGSRVARRLLVEGKDGVRFEVGVGPEVNERAEVGMWIKVSNAQAGLTRPDAQGSEAESADGPLNAPPGR